MKLEKGDNTVVIYDENVIAGYIDGGYVEVEEKLKEKTAGRKKPAAKE